mmetsp:Transcript_32094/g.102096  ORF Transcript_32094/g.102096 Transcript_32094/m.102096 type:complete len:161 (+) Transcript_32094:506-988(+)
MAQHPIVKVLAPKVRIAGRRFHLENGVLDGENRDVERATAHVEDQDVDLIALAAAAGAALLLVRALLVEAIGNGCCCGLVHNPQDIKACNLASVLCGLTLRVVEVRRHRDDGVSNALTHKGLCSLFHLNEDHGGNLLGVELLEHILEPNLYHGFVVLRAV